MMAAWSRVHESYEGYVGEEHFTSMVRVLGYSGVAMCVSEMMKTIDGLMKSTLAPYVTSLLEGLPPIMKRPLLFYGSKGRWPSWWWWWQLQWWW